MTDYIHQLSETLSLLCVVLVHLNFLSKSYVLSPICISADIWSGFDLYEVSLFGRKPVFGVSDQISSNHSFSYGDTGQRLESSEIATRGVR